MAIIYPSMKNVNRKIGPDFSLDSLYKADGSVNDNDRVEIGPTALAFEEWSSLGLTPPNLQRMREYRLKRIVQQLQARDLAGVLLFDPLNIRYATDSSNMQVWTTHNFARACFVSADGYMVLWDFHNCDHLSAHLPLVKEVRSGASFFYFESGEKTKYHASRFVTELKDIVKQCSGSNRRLAVDKIEIAGLRELDSIGFELVDGQEVMEIARSIKNSDEINAMRCSISSTEQAMHQMQIIAQPGMCEAEIWSVLHAENIKRGGEWIECRILSSGPRTNPWFQECGPREIKAGELLAFDTDLIGPYGFCADISRTWLIGDVAPTSEQKHLYRTAYEHIQHNISILKPGMSFNEVTQFGLLLPTEFRAQRYGVMMHGVGLCDEYPSIRYPEDVEQWGYSGQIEVGMTLCVEAYVGAVGGKEGVKLEEQVLITEQGAVVLSNYPFEDPLLS